MALYKFRIIIIIIIIIIISGAKIPNMRNMRLSFANLCEFSVVSMRWDSSPKVQESINICTHTTWLI